MVGTQLADDASVSRWAVPRGQRAGVPHASEDITRIGKGVVIEGEVKGGEDLVIDGKGDGTTIELRQHVLPVGPTGRVQGADYLLKYAPYLHYDRYAPLATRGSGRPRPVCLRPQNKGVSGHPGSIG